MTALSAAEVENVAVRLDGCSRDNEIDFAAGVLVVLDDVAVGLHIQSIEEFTPPFGRKV